MRNPFVMFGGKVYKVVDKEPKEKAPKKENKVLKFVKDHKYEIGTAAVGIIAFIVGMRQGYVNTIPKISSDDLDKVSVTDTEFGQPRYDVDIDDCFATVLYSDGDVGFVGKDYMMNLAERLIELDLQEHSIEIVHF